MNTKETLLLENREKIEGMYLAGNSARQIGKEIGVCRDTVSAYLKIWGIPLRKNSSGWNRPVDHNRWYTRNSNFFSIPTTQNCYWAGFIAADGNITEDNGVRIALEQKDMVLLEKFKEEIEFSGEIKKYPYLHIENRFYVRIEICDLQIISDLEKHWNITPRKTKTLQPPNLENEELIMAYIIGFLDGDGSIGKTQKLHVQICGNLPMLTWIKANLEKYAGMVFTNNIYKSKSIYNFTFTGTNSRKFFRWCESYKGFRLERKWNIKYEY